MTLEEGRTHYQLGIYCPVQIKWTDRHCIACLCSGTLPRGLGAIVITELVTAQPASQCDHGQATDTRHLSLVERQAGFPPRKR